MQRTEEQILAREPFKITFGTTEYDVDILGFRAANKWRKQAVDAVKSIVEVHSRECATNDAFTHGLAFFFLEFPEKMLDLVLSYATAIPREKAEEEATDEQIAVAFGRVVAIAFPFTNEIQMISKVMGIATSFPASARSSTLPS